ncbi:UNVERIFIED_CONTAM: hypothetical protein GTU68_011142 [Idotea baltica]|nr:hypothetical protein [Idotea baltica]
MLGLVLALAIITAIVDFITRKLLLNTFTVFAYKSKSKFDNILVLNKVPRNVAHIIPLIIALELIPTVFIDFPYFENVIEKALQVFAIILTLWIFRSVFNSFKDYAKTLPRFKDKPIDSYIQVFMIFAWIIGIFSIFAIITGVSFWRFATTLGAASAIILLVFKDTILGFVASIQVSINDMVRIGDWITFDKYGADGDVIEINLSTVKVQNFDKTITTIPTYALISDSFKNWRGMSDSGGRRIKRAIILKATSVKYLSPEAIEKLKKIQIISTYLTERQDAIDSDNADRNVDKSVMINGRNLTNLGVFRKYMQSYIENHSAINKDMTIMTRQLAPTSQGLPLEIYAFSSDKRWVNYEYIMSDIFDHCLAAVPYFDLEVFELTNDTIYR